MLTGKTIAKTINNIPDYTNPYDAFVKNLIPGCYSAPSQDRVQCPKCEGFKTIRLSFDEIHSVDEQCNLCNGKGYLDYDDVFLMYHGKK